MWVCVECSRQNVPTDARCRQCGCARPSDSFVGLTIGQWRIERQLGAGGMAIVFLAIHVELGTKAAIKVLRPDMPQPREVVERFRTEAMAASHLKHENVIQVQDFGTQQGIGSYMILEYLDGYDLEERMESGEPLSTPWILGVTEQICKGLQSAHDIGIIHRDIKPSNIFLLPQAGSEIPHVKLLDFGIAKFKEAEFLNTAQKNLTKTGSLLGTPMYLSPEQMNLGSTSGLTHAVDIYALGVVLYQLFTGRSPIMGDTLPQLMAMILYRDPPTAGLFRKELKGTALEFFLQRLLAKQPEDRPSSMLNVWKELQTACQALQDPSTNQSLLQTWQKEHPLTLATGELLTDSGALQQQVGLDDDIAMSDTLLHVASTPQSKSRAPLVFGVLLLCAMLSVGAWWLTRPPATPKVSTKPLAVPLIPKLKQAGFQAFRAKDYLKTIRKLRRVQRSKKWQRGAKHYDPSVYRVLGHALVQRKQYYSAAFFLQRFLQSNKLSKQEQKSVQADLALLQKRLRQQKGSIKNLAKQIRVLFQKQRFGIAYKAFQDLRTIDPSMPDAYKSSIQLLRQVLPSYVMALYRSLLQLDLTLSQRRQIKKDYEEYRKGYLQRRAKQWTVFRDHVLAGRSKDAKKILRRLFSSHADDATMHSQILGFLRSRFVSNPKFFLPLLKLYRLLLLKLPTMPYWQWMKPRLKKGLIPKAQLDTMIESARRAKKPLRKLDKAKDALAKMKLRRGLSMLTDSTKRLAPLQRQKHPLQSELRAAYEESKALEQSIARALPLWKTLSKQAKSCELDQAVPAFRTSFLPLFGKNVSTERYKAALKRWVSNCGAQAQKLYKRALRALTRGRISTALSTFRKARPGLVAKANNAPTNQLLQQQHKQSKRWIERLSQAKPLWDDAKRLHRACQSIALQPLFETKLLPLLAGSKAQAVYQKRWKQWQAKYKNAERALSQAKRIRRRTRCKKNADASKAGQLYTAYLKACPTHPRRAQIKRQRNRCYCAPGVPWLPCKK